MTTIQEIVDSNRLLYPSLFTSFIVPSKLIQERISDSQCSVPVIIQEMDDTEPIFFADKKKEIIQFTLNYLKNKPEYENLYKYITNPDTKLLGISTNQIYIRKAIASNKNKRGYCPPQLKNKNTGWMLLIDIQNRILGFVVLDFMINLI